VAEIHENVYSIHAPGLMLNEICRSCGKVYDRPASIIARKSCTNVDRLRGRCFRGIFGVHDVQLSRLVPNPPYMSVQRNLIPRTGSAILLISSSCQKSHEQVVSDVKVETIDSVVQCLMSKVTNSVSSLSQKLNIWVPLYHTYRPAVYVLSVYVE
jgi:hypothetical protein